MAATILRDSTNKSVTLSNTVAVVTLTTAAVNRLAVIHIYCGTGTVSSIVSAGLTWTRRDRTNTGYEIWTAPVAAIVTALTTTVTIGTSQAVIGLIIDSYYITGSGYIPTVDNVTATAFNATLSAAGSVVTQSNNCTIVSYLVGVGVATLVATAGNGYTLTNSQTWLSGVGIQASEICTADTLNALSPNSPSFTINNSCTGFMITLSLSGTPPTSVTVVPQPTSVVATYVAGSGGNPGYITVTWIAPTGQTTNPTGYLVYRASNIQLNLINGVPQRVNSLQPFIQVAWGTLTFTDRDCGYPPVGSGGNVYTYYVTALYSSTVNPPTLESVLSSASATATFLG